jgi:TonB-linked SusC/RagA family outer membrane protein
MSLINRSIRLLPAICVITLLATPSLVAAQGATGTVTGVVSDSSGTPVPGVRVSVDGVSLATSSGQSGRYTLSNVPAGTQTVRARLLGFRAQTAQATVVAGQTATVNLRLAAAPAELERIVVSTGYGQQTKANVTGASEVVAGEEITKRPVANITKGLQGFMPGVTVQDFGGRPGSDGARVRIRGAGTLGDNGALIIVDGIVGEINNLDPLDIESVSVLKDAASAAIYGARAANGVVIIKTRRGRNTGGLKFSYDGYVATQKAQDMPERVDIRTELETVDSVYARSGQPIKYSAGYIDSTVAGIDPVKYPNTNWLGLIYQSAPMSDQTVRLAGGNDLAQLSVSGNYFDQEGILNTENYYKRATLRANSSFNVSKRLTAQANVMLMHERVARPRGEGDAQFRAIHDTPPTSLAQYPDGAYSWSRSPYNPLAQLREQGWFKDRWVTTSLNTLASYALENGLKFGAQFSADNKDNRQLEFQPSYTFFDPVVSPTTARMNNVRTNSVDRRNTNFNLDAQLTSEYERTFGPHLFHGLVGYEQRQERYDGVFGQRQGAYSNTLQLPAQGDASLQFAGAPNGSAGPATETRLVRQFARLNYSWNNRYLAEFDLSHDGSSRFGPNTKYGTFPSASLAWRISDEPFLRDHLGPINDVKLRGSWGKLGNDRIDDYLFQQTFSINSGNYNFNNQLATGAIPGRLANPNISWESTEQTNVGLDVELLSNRLTLTGDVYNKLTDGILIAVPVSSLIGYTAPTTNAGAVQNTGWEAALNWRHNIGQFNYSIGFNIADNKNKITSLPGGDQIDAQESPSIRRVGYPINSIFGIEAVGIFQTQAEVAAWATQNAKTGPGDLKYKDQNGDGKIDAQDRIVMGDRFPHYTYGSNVSASYRGFDASVLLQGVGKQDVYLNGALIEGPTWENFFATYLLDSWSPQNTDATWPRFVFRSDHNQNAPGANSWYVRDGKYLSLKNLNFGYTLPQRLVGRGGLSSARVYIAGTNVYTWSPLKGIVPPEANPGSTRATYYYQTRNWSIGTNLGF